MFLERFLSVNITFTVLDSELYIDKLYIVQAVDTFHVGLWGQKMMYLYYAFCSQE